MHLHDVLQSKVWNDFLTVAKGYIDLIENHQPADQTDFIKKIQRSFIDLYSTGLLIPEINQTAGYGYERDFVVEMKPVIAFVAQRVPFSYYWAVLNAMELNESPQFGTGDLIDDIWDIYHDLKRGMLAFDEGTVASQEHAIWQFKFNYDFHWATHCINGLSAIHEYLENIKLNGS
jgi:hypothetical protein